MKSRFFTLFFLSFSSIICHATHNRAGEITFRQVGVRTYEVTITTYTKSDAPADRCDLLIEWGDGSSSTLYRVTSFYFKHIYESTTSSKKTSTVVLIPTLLPGCIVYL